MIFFLTLFCLAFSALDLEHLRVLYAIGQVATLLLPWPKSEPTAALVSRVSGGNFSSPEEGQSRTL